MERCKKWGWVRGGGGRRGERGGGRYKNKGSQIEIAAGGGISNEYSSEGIILRMKGKSIARASNCVENGGMRKIKGDDNIGLRKPGQIGLNSS